MKPEVCNYDRLVGAEVKGIEASQPLPASSLELLMDCLDRYSMLYMRNQKLTDSQLVEFFRQFGTLKPTNLGRFFVPGFTELHNVSNILEDGELVGNPDAGVFWHTDAAYTPKPDTYSFLYSLEVPMENGKSLGNTSWASTAAAYEALPHEMKEKLHSLKAVQSLERQAQMKAAVNLLKRGDITEHEKKIGISAIHPLVRTHPRSGRKSLYVSEGHTSTIVDMDPQESDALLRQLNEHITQPQFVYTHEWQVGDVVIWDNRTALHKAAHDYKLPLRRLMRRAVTLGEVPV